jgi:hypothetical protein
MLMKKNKKLYLLLCIAAVNGRLTTGIGKVMDYQSLNY